MSTDRQALDALWDFEGAQHAYLKALRKLAHATGERQHAAAVHAYYLHLVANVVWDAPKPNPELDTPPPISDYEKSKPLGFAQRCAAFRRDSALFGE